MVAKETILEIVEKIWAKPEISKYCKIGQGIIKSKGPASTEFDEHVIRCGQCSKALEEEWSNLQ